VSIPIIVWGSQIVLKLMERFPIVITLGAMLLGWIAGQMAYTDIALQGIRPEGKLWEYTCAALGALFVLLVGQFMQRRAAKSSS
jgi:predicted tellurium resistance membrane protein TerC